MSRIKNASHNRHARVAMTGVSQLRGMNAAAKNGVLRGTLRRRNLRRLPYISSLTAFILCCALLCAACGQTASQSAARAATSRSTPGTASTATAAPTAQSASSTQTSAATLRCTMREEPVTTDTVSVTLSRAVANAVGNDTSFTATYTSIGLKGQGHVADASCHGPLYQGSGACTVTFILSARNSALGSVTGELLPSHRSIGPVTPVLGS